MANKAREKSPKQKYAETVYKSVVKAKEAFEKNASSENKKALAEAEKAYEAAKLDERRERFINVGNARAVIVLQKLGALAKCANKRGYEFDEIDINRLEKKLGEEIEFVIATFRNALTGKVAGPKSTAPLFE